VDHVTTISYTFSVKKLYQKNKKVEWNDIKNKKIFFGKFKNSKKYENLIEDIYKYGSYIEWLKKSYMFDNPEVICLCEQYKKIKSNIDNIDINGK